MPESLDPLEERFAAALARPPGDRAAFLQVVSMENPVMAQELAGLLRAYETSGDYLEQKPGEKFADSGRDAILASLPSEFPEEQPGARIGRYRLLEKIGEGGGGVVYRAEQEQPVQRRVALKILKLGMDTRAVVARFEAERQALALMDHPNIARVFDAGETERGRPFFVMELVEGVPITRLCDESRLTVVQRVELFIKVCQAIQHAHQKGIIHRDIKPSNVLVARQDGQAVPKIIDFGIAKATAARLTERTLVTEFAQLVGTPAYMSPEQLDFGQADIDTRSDVYALGVLLYELLAGRPPFPTKDLWRGGLDEMRRRIREEEPARPSAAVAALAVDALRQAAEERNGEPGRLAGHLRGELDWIVMRCLEKDRARRYPTANSLAEDLRRHLHNEPVTAAAPGGFYAFKKFARRHRAAFAAGLAFASLLIVAVGVSAWLAARATRAEQLAQARLRTETVARASAERERTRAETAEKSAKEEAARATAINDFLQNDILLQATPSRQKDRNLTVRDAVDVAARRIDWKLVGQPLVELALRETLGRTYVSLGEYHSAEVQIDRAILLARQERGAEHVRTLSLLTTRTELLRLQGRVSEAETSARDLLEMQTRLSGAESEEALNLRHQIAALLLEQGRAAQAEPVINRVVALHSRARGAGDPVTLTARNTLGNVWLELGRIAEAEKLHRDVLEIRVRYAGESSLDAAYSMNGLASVLRWKGDYAGAIALLRRVIEFRARVLGPDHPETLGAQGNLALTLSDAGSQDEAATLAAQVGEARTRVLGAEHPVTIATAHTRATIYRRRGQLAEAEALLTAARDTARRVLGAAHPTALLLTSTQGEVWLLADKVEAAVAALRENIAQREKVAPEAWAMAADRVLLGAALVRQGKPADAEPLLLVGVAGLAAHESQMPASQRPRHADARRALAELYERAGRLDEAAKWR